MSLPCYWFNPEVYRSYMASRMTRVGFPHNVCDSYTRVSSRYVCIVTDTAYAHMPGMRAGGVPSWVPHLQGGCRLTRQPDGTFRGWVWLHVHEPPEGAREG